jgi:hypothetical protein
VLSALYRHSNSQAKPLRIGVLADGLEMPQAFRQVLLDIQSSDFARLEVLDAVTSENRRKIAP